MTSGSAIPFSYSSFLGFSFFYILIFLHELYNQLIYHQKLILYVFGRGWGGDR